MDLALRGGTGLNGEFVFDLLFGPEVLSLIDKIPQISLVMIPADHMSNFFPDRIKLPWDQRTNIRALLSRNCAD